MIEAGTLVKCGLVEGNTHKLVFVRLACPGSGAATKKHHYEEPKDNGRAFHGMCLRP